MSEAIVNEGAEVIEVCSPGVVHAMTTWEFVQGAAQTSLWFMIAGVCCAVVGLFFIALFWLINRAGDALLKPKPSDKCQG